VIRVIHVGASVKAKGGVAAVIANLLGELERDPEFRVTAIPTTLWREKGLLVDALVGLVGLFRVVLACFSRPRPILHLHLCSRGSTLRKGIIARLARALHTPCVIHDHSLEDYFRRSGTLVRWWLGGTFSRADAIVTLTDKEKRFLSSLVRCPIQSIPNAVVLPSEMKESQESSDGTIRFLFLGKLMRTKGVYELLEACAICRREGLPIHLTLGGNGEVEECRRWARERGLENCIDVPGWLEGSSKGTALKQANVFVLPSHTEAFGIAIIEAMGYGLPVIATRVGGIPEVVVENETGLLVQPRDIEGLVGAMRRLTSDVDLRRRLGRAGRKRVEERYSLPTVCAHMKELYRHVAS